MGERVDVEVWRCGGDPSDRDAVQRGPRYLCHTRIPGFLRHSACSSCCSRSNHTLFAQQEFTRTYRRVFKQSERVHDQSPLQVTGGLFPFFYHFFKQF